MTYSLFRATYAQPGVYNGVGSIYNSLRNDWSHWSINAYILCMQVSKELECSNR